MRIDKFSLDAFWKRSFDVALCLVVLPAAVPVLVCAAIAIKMSDPGPIFHWSRRVGRNNIEFKMVKLRTMRLGSPDVATHLLEDRATWLTPVGPFLRATSIDELPQIFNVLAGHMSLVGPRPALHNQGDLVELRTRLGIHLLRPGITGLAQISGRDELSVEEKVGFDAEYLKRQSLVFDARLLARSVSPVARRKSIT